MNAPRPYFLFRTGQAFAMLVVIAFSMGMRPAPMADKAQFEIHKGDDIVGRIVAVRNGQGDRTTYLMTSYSEFQVIWKQIVRTTMVSEYTAGQLNNCHTNLWVNSALRDSSHMRTSSSKYDCFVHPDRRFVHSTSDEMDHRADVLRGADRGQRGLRGKRTRALPLGPLGDHRYRLFMPDAKVNDYTYKNGVLHGDRRGPQVHRLGVPPGLIRRSSGIRRLPHHHSQHLRTVGPDRCSLKASVPTMSEPFV